MKYCCGRKYPDNYTYCTQCGKKLEVDFFGELGTNKDTLFTDADKDAFKLFSEVK